MEQHRTALVTGAASGIGAVTAQRFLKAGFRVALFDLNSVTIQENGGHSDYSQNALALQGDAANETDVRSAIERALAEFGSVDVLVNNVGIEMNGTVLQQSVEEWDRQLAVNLRSSFLFSKHCIPAMKSKGGGAIINISSCHAFVSWPRCAAYDASKAGMLGLTRALAIDHGSDGIRVNAICPGYIRTPLLQQRFSSGSGDEKEALRFHPLGRMGEPADVANAVFFLASDEASFITGTVLNVDGGLMAAGH